MTTSTITPNGTAANNGGAVTGAASIHAALADASDSSYVELDTPTDSVQIDFGTFSLPAGAVIVQVTNLFRAAMAGASVPHPFCGVGRVGASGFAQNITTSPTDYSNTYTNIAGQSPSSQADIDGYRMEMRSSFGGGALTRFYEASVTVTYALVPTAAVTAPSGTVTDTLSPSVTWTHTAGSDAPGGQTKYQVRVFTAAQYGAGGFDAGTSTAAFDTGVVASSATSAVVGPLANSTTYRAYVRTAQTTLGVDQWSAWDYEGFDTDVDTSDVDTVVATADDTNARIEVVVSRDTGSEDWESIEVQASYDAGSTWVYVRGYNGFVPSGDSVTLYDYEAPNNVAAVYRARATYTAGGVITGAWVESSPETWSSGSDWLKNPYDSTLNRAVTIAGIDNMTANRPQGVFKILGRADPIVISDVPQNAAGMITFTTLTDSDATALRSLFASATLLLQTPATDQWGSRYIAIGSVTETRTAPGVRGEPSRWWQVPFNEIRRPADLT